MIDVGKDLQSAYDYGYRQGVKDTLDDIHKTLERSLREKFTHLIKTEPNNCEPQTKVETMSCAECKHRPIGAEICEEVCHYEPQTDWHYDEQDATWYPYKHEDEPQTYITEDRDTQILDSWQVHHRNTTSVEDEPQADCPWNKPQMYDSYRDYEYDKALEQMEREDDE